MNQETDTLVNEQVEVQDAQAPASAPTPAEQPVAQETQAPTPAEQSEMQETQIVESTPVESPPPQAEEPEAALEAQSEPDPVPETSASQSAEDNTEATPEAEEQTKPGIPKIHQPGNKEALALWYTVILQGVRDRSYDLSARQMAIMLTVYIDPKPYSVRMLSTRLNISKPAICRALDALEREELVKRKHDEKDRRNVFVNRTEKGYEFLGGFSDNILNNLMAIQ